MKLRLPLRCSSAGRSLRRGFPLALATLGLWSAAPLSADEVQAVNGRVATDYVRVKLADGTFQPETYAFGPGGYWSAGAKNKSIDDVKFLDVAHVLAVPLANRGYLPAKDPKTTKLLIMVYWGLTTPVSSFGSSTAFQDAAGAMNGLANSVAVAFASHNTMNDRVMAPSVTGNLQRERGGTYKSAEVTEAENVAASALAALQMENRLRRRQAVENAKLLGYDSWWDSTAHFEGTPLDLRRQDMMIELEDSRYFVVLMAYDFQLMWKEKKAKLLWETRFSISQRHHEFDKALPAMAHYAAKFFGRDSQGLQHSDAPIGRVELGDLKPLEEDPEQKP